MKSHLVEISEDIAATYYDDFPTVEIFDGDRTIYLSQEEWAGLIEVLQKAQAAHTATINENKSD